MKNEKKVGLVEQLMNWTRKPQIKSGVIYTKLHKGYQDGYHNSQGSFQLHTDVQSAGQGEISKMNFRYCTYVDQYKFKRSGEVVFLPYSG